MFNPRILHISEDEKFLNAALFIFEKSFPDRNSVIILKPSGNPPLKYVSENPSLKIEVDRPELIDHLIHQETGFDIIVFHGMSRIMAALYLKSAQRQKYLWLLYGAEVYNERVLGSNYIENGSAHLIKEISSTSITDIIKNIYRKIRYRSTSHIYDGVSIPDAIYNIQNIGLLIDENLESLLNNEIVNPGINKVPFTFYPLEYIITDKNLYARGNHILLGNSSSVTNNHLQAFELLGRLNLKGRKVITPLSYGSDKYAASVKRLGKKHLGKHFSPLEKFLPLHEYNKIITRCGVVIMNHYRPQAIGNIIASLYIGSKVFLNETSVYHFFRELGCHVFLIQKDLHGGNTHALERLSDDKIQHNRRVLRNVLSTDAVSYKLRESITSIYSDPINHAPH
jgi:dTDP-N-acetylfucosamine:lipid II N-acetylfucosaminyltransferase